MPAEQSPHGRRRAALWSCGRGRPRAAARGGSSGSRCSAAASSLGPGPGAGRRATGGRGGAGRSRSGPRAAGQRSGRPSTAAPAIPASGTVGASGASLLAHPDSYAELGGTTLPDRDRDGRPGLHDAAADHLAGGRSAIAYKRDFGLGGGPVAGLPAGHRPVVAARRCAADPLRARPLVRGGPGRAAAGHGGGGRARSDRRARRRAEAASPTRRRLAPAAGRSATAGCRSTAGPTGRLLADGSAAAPAGAPAAVRGIIAAGNQIAGQPYLYGAGHGLPLDQIAPAYDCSSSVEHLLYGGGLLPGRLRRRLGDARVLRAPGPGPLGDDLRQRRSRVHVRRRAALGHLERRRPRTAAPASAGTR